MKAAILSSHLVRRMFVCGVALSTPFMSPDFLCNSKSQCGISIAFCETISEKVVIESINNELLSTSEAQRLKIYRKKSLMTKNEIEQLLKFEFDNRDKLGTTRRDGSGIKRPDSPWHTSYMSTNGLFQRNHQELLDKLIDVAIEADVINGWNILTNNVNYFGYDVDKDVNTQVAFNSTSTKLDEVKSNLRVRVVELHSVDKNGSLADTHHCDIGSLVTIDVMLTAPDVDYTGGQFGTLEKDGKLHMHTFEYGDVVVFPSHKYHCVQPVTSGNRKVMVIELWHGKTRNCAHRCLLPYGDCTYSTMQSKIEKYLTASMPEVDPW